MVKIYDHRKKTKQQGVNFTAALLGSDNFIADKKPAFEPKNKNIGDEISIQSAILDELMFMQAQGLLFVQRINNTPIYDEKIHAFRSLPKGTQAGFPDILVLKNGRTIFFEVKSGVGDQRPEQVLMQKLIEKQGGEYYIVRSIDYVKKALQQQTP